MRGWKLILAAVVLLAAASATGVYFLAHDGEIGGFAGATPPAQHAFVMPVPVTPVVKKTVPVYLEYAARTESIRNIPLQAASPAISRRSPRPTARM